MSKRLIVIGGGASGFFCAVNAARLCHGLQVTIFEKQNKVLQKVKVSGGGRCNVTHACFMHSQLLKKYPRGKSLLKKSVLEFSAQDTINWFAERGVTLHTEEDGRMFPDTNDSQTIINCLLNESNKYQVELCLNTEIEELKKENDVFILKDKKGKIYEAEYVMIACGGYSKDEQYQWICSTGHHFETPVPSLFTFNIPNNNISKLMGLSVENAIVKITGSKHAEQGAVLITHWGLSGPAVIRLSAWAARELHEKKYDFQIQVNWTGITENILRNTWNEIRTKQSGLTLGTKNPFALPHRLWEYFLELCDISSQTKWSELNAKEQNKLIHVLTAQELEVKGKTTFKEEFVTCGGIALSEINNHTMESKLLENLFFGGEILDVDGITGGFNFQHAWSSGMSAAKAIAEREIF